jgi:hypothetical protein
LPKGREGVLFYCYQQGGHAIFAHSVPKAGFGFLTYF